MTNKIRLFVRKVILDEKICRATREEALDVYLEYFTDHQNYIYVNGRQLRITSALTDEIQALINDGKKIRAIKLLRQETGLGLLDAKNAVYDSGNFKQ